MNDSDKVKMTIKIGGEHLQLSVAFNRQDAVRDAEKAAASLYDTWRSRWPSRSDKEILAMVAYQFASYYQELLSRLEDAAATVAETDARLSAIIDAEKKYES
ncbi:MAG: cell division protein ZapA [Muribaculaceae bacterium]|nr:cell division protein ZapA [Muribaculaceae bacterium]